MNGSCLHVGWVIGPWNKTKADAMICHAKYNRSIYDKHFIQDYKLIVSVRDPVSWMQSAIHYFMYDLRYVKKMVSSMFRHSHLASNYQDGVTDIETKCIMGRLTMELSSCVFSAP